MINLFAGVKFAQLAFGLFIVLFAPGLAFLALFLRADDLRQRILKVLATACVTVIGFVFAALIAIFSCPNYPMQGPPEFLAWLFILIAYGISLVGFKLLQKPSTDIAVQSNYKIVNRFVLLLVLICSAVSFIGYSIACQPEHRSLPWTATEVSEHFDGEPLMADFSYYLKAKVSESQLNSYIEKLQLNEASNSDIDRQMRLTRKPVISIDWWDLPDAGNAIHFQRKIKTLTVSASYVDGYVYVSAVRH